MADATRVIAIEAVCAAEALDLRGIEPGPATRAVLVALRAEPKPLEPADTRSSLAAALVVPMLHRNEVVGIVLLGRKPSGLNYRPDEIELIGWATRQVGLDLHALKVEQLETAAAALREENIQMQARNQELRLALGARAT